MSWQPGNHITIAMVDFGMLFQVLPVTVVHDQPHELMVWLPEGTMYRHRIQPDGAAIPRVLSPDAFTDLDTILEETTSTGRTVLAVLPRGRRYAVQLHWDMPGWRFRQWYVNFQTPFQRTDHGIQSTDQFLDIVVFPDMTWRWKDAAELDEAVRVHRLTSDEASAIREEGERVAREIEHGLFPFDTDLRNWRPNPEWTRAR